VVNIPGRIQALIDHLGLIFPPEEKFQSLCQKILIFSNSPSVTARQFSQLLGFLNSLADVVPLGRLHIRPLQFFLQEHWDSASQDWENPSKNMWCNRQAKRDSQKLVNLVVPEKSEKFPGSQRNWDMEISIRKVQFGS
jgi:hypothetical protein